MTSQINCVTYYGTVFKSVKSFCSFCWLKFWSIWYQSDKRFYHGTAKFTTKQSVWSGVYTNPVYNSNTPPTRQRNILIGLMRFLRLMEAESRYVEEELLEVAHSPLSLPQSCCRHYEFVQKLGEGGFGFMYEGTRCKDGLKVVVFFLTKMTISVWYANCWFFVSLIRWLWNFQWRRQTCHISKWSVGCALCYCFSVTILNL